MASVPTSCDCQNLQRSCLYAHSAFSCASCRHVRVLSPALHRPRGVERHERTVDDHFHADHGSLAAALRPPASESRPTHRGRDCGDASGSPSLDGAWVARQDANGLRLSDVTELTEPELLQEVLELRRRVRKLMALLRLALALLQTSGFRLTVARLPDGRDKLRILRAVDRAREHAPLRALLRTWSPCPNIDTSRPARSPSSPSGSARSGPRPLPGTASCGRTAGAAPPPRAPGEVTGGPSHNSS